jgi:predicted metal-binding membrane protein
MQAAYPTLTAMLKRDRVVVTVSLAVLTLLAFAYVVWLSAQMAMPTNPTGAEMPAAGATSGDGMDMGAATGPLAPAFRAWVPADFAFMFAMWSVMMVGMMTPPVAPMVLLYAAVGRKAAEGGAPFASTGWFFAGYIAMWIAFGALATSAQWALTSLALLTPMLATTSTVAGGILLVAVGLYQWTPLKDTCLRACQTPLDFLMAHGGFRREPRAAFGLGFVHGAYCLGCCFALMGLLFVGGIMNVLWIASLTILVFVEKIVPTRRLIPRISGALIGAAGIWLLVGAA